MSVSWVCDRIKTEIELLFKIIPVPYLVWGWVFCKGTPPQVLLLSHTLSPLSEICSRPPYLCCHYPQLPTRCLNVLPKWRSAPCPVAQDGPQDPLSPKRMRRRRRRTMKEAAGCQEGWWWREESPPSHFLLHLTPPSAFEAAPSGGCVASFGTWPCGSWTKPYVGKRGERKWVGGRGRRVGCAAVDENCSRNLTGHQMSYLSDDDMISKMTTITGILSLIIKLKPFQCQ